METIEESPLNKEAVERNKNSHTAKPKRRRQQTPLGFAWQRFKYSWFFKFLEAVYYSLPSQLLLSQLRNHKTLLAFWLLLFLWINQQVMMEFGSAYLMLEPEYMNKVDFWSLFLIGVGFGIFSLAYQMTCYILDGYRFFFLGFEKKPFLKFSLNNSLIPTVFWINFAVSFLKFQLESSQRTPAEVYWMLFGSICGGGLVTILALAYFESTNKDLFKLFGEGIINELKPRKAIIQSARRSLNMNLRVDYFFPTFFKVKAVQNNIRADFRKLVRVLNQNHSNALVAELFLLILLSIIGLFQHNPYFRIPAGVSFLILFSFFIMLVGALTFWFRQIGPLSAIILLSGFYFFNQWDAFVGKNYAFGLDYNSPPAGYAIDSLKQLVKPEYKTADSLHTIQILENWKKRYESIHGTERKPKMVFLCVTGGGTRSAVWTVKCLQYVDQQLDGKLSDQIELITGASGGMMGAAYYRELMLQKRKNPKLNIYEQKYLENIAKDLLNPIVLNMTSTLLIPQQVFQDGSNRYEKDRGYEMEIQYAENLQAIFDKRLKDYYQPEFDAQIPLMIFSPTIINDGRQLIISSQPVSYLSTPMKFNEVYTNEIGAVEFGRLFQSHNAQNLRFTTAVRMNASFPTVMPFVELPTHPKVEVMDAGLLDNFGLITASKFLRTFQDWISANTESVVILQLRDSKREQEVQDSGPRTIIGKVSGLGGAYNTLSENKDYVGDFIMEQTQTWYKGKIDVLELQYIPSKIFREASLNFHLTQREKDDVVESIHNQENKKVIAKLKELLK